MNTDMMKKAMSTAPMPEEGQGEHPDAKVDAEVMGKIEEFFNGLKEEYPDEAMELEKGYIALKAALEQGEVDEETEGKEEADEGESAPMPAKTKADRHKIMISMMTGGKQ